MAVMTAELGCPAPPGCWPADAPLADADYADGFAAATPHALGESPEQWARHVLEGASPAMRLVLRLGWRFGLGFRPARHRAVLGGPVVAQSGDWVVLQQQSWLFGVALLMRAAEGRLTWATRVKYRSPVAGVTWAVVGMIHRRFAPRALQRAVRQAAMR
jgi:hypothetical protein